MGIYLAPVTRQGFVVRYFRLVYNNVASAVGEGEWNAQEILQPPPQCFLPLGWNKEEHKAAATRAQELAAQRSGTASGFVNLVNVGFEILWVSDLLIRQPSCNSLPNSLSERLGLVTIDSASSTICSISINSFCRLRRGFELVLCNF